MTRWTMLLVAVLVAACSSRPSGPPEVPAPEAAPTAAPALPAAPTTVDDDGPGCTMERLRATVTTRLPAVTACYRAAARTDPALSGRLAVELGIERDGRLVNRSVRESPFPIPMNQCVVDALEGLRFAGRFEKPCIVVYPFVFSASGAPRR